MQKEVLVICQAVERGEENPHFHLGTLLGKTVWGRGCVGVEERGLEPLKTLWPTHLGRPRAPPSLAFSDLENEQKEKIEEVGQPQV